jgi:hypothetical protein
MRTPEEIEQIRQEILPSGTLTDQDKLTYTEAGGWVRLTNNLWWSMLIAVVPILVGLLAGAGAIASTISKWVLAGGSIVLGAAWLYFDWLYERSKDAAREILTDIEESIERYSGQREMIPRIYSMNGVGRDGARCLNTSCYLFSSPFWAPGLTSGRPPPGIASALPSRLRKRQ